MVSLEFFIDIILSDCTVAPLTEMTTRNISYGGKGGRCVGLTTLPPSCADCLEIWEPQPSWNPQSYSRPVMGLLYLFTCCLVITPTSPLKTWERFCCRVRISTPYLDSCFVVFLVWLSWKRELAWEISPSVCKQFYSAGFWRWCVTSELIEFMELSHRMYWYFTHNSSGTGSIFFKK
jgi:hypothetical protein